MNKTFNASLFFLFIFCASSSFAQEDYRKILENAFQNSAIEIPADFHISHQYQDKHNRVWHYYGIQKHKGLPVYPAFFDIHTLDGDVIVSHQSFVPNKSLSNLESGNLTSDECLMAAADFLNLPELKSTPIRKAVNPQSEVSDIEWNILQWSKEKIKGKKAFLFLNEKLYPVWIINLQTLDRQHWYNLFVSAVDGSILEQQDWVISCNLHPEHSGKYHLHSDESDGLQPNESNAAKNSYKVFRIPVESPIHGSHVEVISPWDSSASPYGWHDVNGVNGAEYTITRGNNVFAMDDKDADNSSGYSPDGGSDLIFDAPFDPSKPATDFLDASIINLFYMNNIMHDVWYQYGFDEQSGNFQQNNYGKGGTGGDFVMADAMDGSGTNNANFATPEDGENPRMQMFIWTASAGSAKLINILPPSGIAGGYSGVQAGFTPQLTKTPVTGKLVLVNSLISGTIGCDSFANFSAIKGNIALIDRGTCTFQDKIQRAQAAGAKAVIVINNTSSAPFSMSGNSTGISIPAIMISQSMGSTFKTAVNAGTVNVSLSDSSSVGLKVMDSDFDNGIIAHEYGHGISTRLTGGAMNSSCLTNQEQMGEGWSDFFSLVMTHEPGDKGSDSRGIGNYVTAESVNGGGIRTYPYSTNMGISPYTYDDVKTLSVPHGVGSVWCAMLWDMYWDLTDKYGYDSDLYRGKGGNNIAMQLVIDGMKLQPCNPGFEDGRDAILLADRLNNKGANQLLIWNAFARRGLGFDADQGSTNSRSDGKEGFQIPPSLKNAIYVQKQAQKNVLQGDTINYQVLIKNLTPNVFKDLTFNDTLSIDVSYLNSSGCPLQWDNGILSMQLDSLSPGDSLICRYSVKVTTPRFTHPLLEEGFELSSGNWKLKSDLGTDTFKFSTLRKNSGSRSLYIVNPETQSDQSAVFTYQLDTIISPALEFYHFYKTEDAWDGAVVEVSVGGQNDWKDADELFLIGGYNKLISTNPQSRISGQKAFTGNSNGFVQSMLDLSEFAGKTVDVRFRFVSDGAASEEGWYIDDVRLMSLSLIENKVYVNSASNVSSHSMVKTLIYENEQSTSVNSVHSQNFRIYPNPAHSELMFEFEGENCKTITVNNTLGEVIFTKDMCSKTEKINLSNYSSGMYFIQIQEAQKVSVVKIVKN